MMMNARANSFEYAKKDYLIELNTWKKRQAQNGINQFDQFVCDDQTKPPSHELSEQAMK